MRKLLNMIVLQSLSLSPFLSGAIFYDEAGNAYNFSEPICCTPPCGQVTLNADYLYWEAAETGLEYGVVNSTLAQGSIPNGVPNLIENETLTPTFKSSSGFRVAIGYEAFPKEECGQVCSSGWQVGLIGTHLTSSASSCFSPGVINPNESVKALTPGLVALQPISGLVFTAARGKWSLNYSSADLDFGYSCHPFSCVTLTPHVGIRATWMTQNYDIHFSNEDTSNLPINVAIDTKLKQDFVAGGIEAGLIAGLEFGCGISAVASVSGSILYAREKVYTKQNGSPLNNTVDFLLSDFRSKHTIHNGVPTFEYFLGLQWQTKCCGNEFSLYAGWEEHILFDTNHFIVGQGNLTLSGLTVGVGLGF